MKYTARVNLNRPEGSVTLDSFVEIFDGSKRVASARVVKNAGGPRGRFTGERIAATLKDLGYEHVKGTGKSEGVMWVFDVRPT
jgi:hypothetical protein